MTWSRLSSALAFGAAGALFDLLAAGQAQGFRFEPAAAVLVPTAAMTVGLAALFLLLAGVLERRGNQAPEAVTTAVLGAPLAAAAVVAGASLTPLGKALVYGVSPPAAGFAAWSAVAALRARDYPLERLERVLLLAPALLAMSVGMRIAANDVLDATVGKVLALAAAAGALLLYRSVRRSEGTVAVRRLSAAVAAMIVAAPAANALLPSGAIETAGAAVERPAIEHVVLLTVDTLRPDALSAYGSDVETPNIDRLAQDCVVFRNARSAAPWTGPSFASIMTGLTPFVHGYRRSGDAFPAGAQTLAERFRDAGYRTGAVAYNYHLAAHLAPDLARGFDDYDVHPTAPKPATLAHGLYKKLRPTAFLGRWRTPHLTSGAEDWLALHASENFLFWLHYFDPHAPYEPSGEWAPDGTPDPLIGMRTAPTMALDAAAGDLEITPERLRWIRTLYEAEVQYVDSEVGKALDALRRLGIYDEALIVMLSDHGEEFFEHEALDHGHNLYDVLLRVPLMVKLPASLRGQARTGAVEGLVSTAALTPTLLELAAVPHDAEDFSTRSLAAYWGDEPIDPEPVFSTGIYARQQQQAVAFGPWKYIRNESYPRRELYHVQTDPLESRELSAENPDVVAQADRLLNEHLEQSARLAELHGLTDGTGKAQLDATDIEKLRSLGYVQ